MATKTLRPNAAGDECNIGGETGDACPNHYLNVDEENADEHVTEVTGNANAFQRDLYNIEDSSGSGTINKITLYFRVRHTKNGATTKGVIKAGETVSETATKNPFGDFGRNVWGTYSEEWATNPDDDEAWEWADIDALQIGVSLNAFAVALYAHCTQVYVVVDYTTGPIPDSYNKILYTSEPPTPNAWNQVKREAGTGWRKLLYV